MLQRPDGTDRRLTDYKNYLPAIDVLLERAEVLDFAVAFWGSGAERLLEKAEGKPVRILCNLSMGGTNVDAIRKLRRMFGPESVKCSSDLHAKLVVSGQEAVVGSANISANGLRLEGALVGGWQELGWHTNDPVSVREAREWFDKQWDTAKVVGDEDLLAEEERLKSRHAWEATQPLVRGKKVRLLDHDHEELDGIYLALYREHVPDDVDEASDKLLAENAGASFSRRPGKTAGWPSLPSGVPLLFFIYGDEGIEADGAWIHTSEWDHFVTVENGETSVQIMFEENSVRGLFYDKREARKLAAILKPVLGALVKHAGHDGEAIVPLRDALALAKALNRSSLK